MHTLKDVFVTCVCFTHTVYLLHDIYCSCLVEVLYVFVDSVFDAGFMLLLAATYCNDGRSVDILIFAGFTELCQEDQIKLIKQGSFEVIIARYVPLFTDDAMFVPDMSVRVPRFVCFL